jgi:hypothetical protein
VRQTTARWWFGLTAFAAGFGIVVQLFVTANADTGFPTSLARTLNVFVFFTILSNLTVGVTSMLLALNPNRSSIVFSVFRLIGVVSIVITGLVFHAVLKDLLDLESWALVADNTIHTVVPVLAVVVWIAYGPRDLVSRRIVGLSALYPVAWLAFTLIRGEIVGFYPYPFVDVGTLGYPRVLVNCVWVAVLYLAVAGGANALDRWLTRMSAVGARERDA